MNTMDMQCNICDATSLPLAKALVLKKHEVQYYACVNCGFIQTERPYWLEEAYSSAIARSDIGLIGRNIKLANFCSALIPIFYSPDATFLDYGGGNGMFVRMMRDKGFNYYWYDKFASNQFAAGFEASQEQKFSLITAFEVFEHLLQPLEAVDEMLRYSDALIFSTRLLPRWKIMPSEWWYFTLDTGQHVSLYSRESLKVIAQRFNLNFSSNGISLHVLSKIAIPSLLLQALSYPPLSAILSGLLNLRRPSLLEQDYYRITGVRLDQ